MSGPLDHWNEDADEARPLDHWNEAAGEVSSINPQHETGATLDDLFFDDTSPLTEQEKEDLQFSSPREKRPCPVCGKSCTWLADGSRPRQHKCKEVAAGAVIPPRVNVSLPPAPGGPTVDEVVAKYIETRDLIAEKTKALEKELEVLKSFQNKREAWLQGKLDASGVESMRTAHGTCFVDWKDSVSVADPDIFLTWVHEDWENRRTFLTNAANKTAVKQRLSENDTPPPGVNYTKIKGVKIRRA